MRVKITAEKRDGYLTGKWIMRFFMFGKWTYIGKVNSESEAIRLVNQIDPFATWEK